MAQIPNAQLQILIDRMVRHASENDGVSLYSNLNVLNQTSPTGGLAFANNNLAGNPATINAPADAVVSADLMPAFEALNLSNPVAQYTPNWAAAIQALEFHLARYNAKAAGDLCYLDAALRVINAGAPTLRAHSYWNTYFGRLSPANVFAGAAYTLATISVTGATTATFTLAGAVSNGLLDLTKYGTGQIKVQNTKGEGLTSTVFTFTVVKAGVATPGITSTITLTTNNQVTVLSDTALTMSGVTALTAITGGFSGDTFNVVIVPDRTINAV